MDFDKYYCANSYNAEKVIKRCIESVSRAASEEMFRKLLRLMMDQQTKA